MGRIADLFYLARAGDPEAREKLFLYLRARYRFLAKSKVSEGDLEDVVHDTLMVVQEHFSEIQTRQGLLEYTDAVLRNIIGNYYYYERQRKRRQVELHSGDPESVDRGRSQEPQIEAALMYPAVRRAIELLGESRPRCRALLLAICEGVSVRELAESLGAPRARVDEWLLRCRKALREILSGRPQ
ncbi:MAG: sigma-70 family RNA polymerase sigma factor [Acidobacteriota bacterium]